MKNLMLATAVAALTASGALAADVKLGVSLGFTGGADTGTDYDRMKAKVQDELKQHFRPEFLNRVDDTIVFPQLSQEEIVQIVDLEIAKLDKRLKDKDMGIELTPAAKELLAKRGYDPVLGAPVAFASSSAGGTGISRVWP